MFEAERPSLVPYGVRFDNNRYSVSAHAVGRPVEIRAYADRIELEPGHVRIMMACAETCWTSAAMMLIGTERHKHTAANALNSVKSAPRAASRSGYGGLRASVPRLRGELSQMAA